MDEQLRLQLAEVIRGKGAHLNAEAIFNGVRDEHWGAQPEGAPHTLWQLLEHTRIALHDLVVFSNDPNYVAPKWPDEYWPASQAPESPEQARHSVAALKDAVAAMAALVGRAETDLFARIPWGDGQTVLHEALLAIDHTGYHLGQAMFLRKQLEATPS